MDLKDKVLHYLAEAQYFDPAEKELYIIAYTRSLTKITNIRDRKDSGQHMSFFKSGRGINLFLLNLIMQGAIFITHTR